MEITSNRIRNDPEIDGGERAASPSSAGGYSREKKPKIDSLLVTKGKAGRARGTLTRSDTREGLGR